MFTIAAAAIHYADDAADTMFSPPLFADFSRCLDATPFTLLMMPAAIERRCRVFISPPPPLRLAATPDIFARATIDATFIFQMLFSHFSKIRHFRQVAI
jgi:hypothetical protein